MYLAEGLKSTFGSGQDISLIEKINVNDLPIRARYVFICNSNLRWSVKNSFVEIKLFFFILERFLTLFLLISNKINF